jgi:hypothetical protein
MATPTPLPGDFTPGQILTAADMDNLRGAFRILQVIYGNTTTEVTNATNSYVDTTLTASITPQATSSKVLVMVSQQVSKNAGNGENRVQLRTLRDATEIANSGNLFLYTGTAIFNMATYSVAVLDSPSTTSSVTYKTQFLNPNATTEIRAQTVNGRSTMILLEVSA